MDSNDLDLTSFEKSPNWKVEKAIFTCQNGFILRGPIF
jgi:hypothetical protein